MQQSADRTATESIERHYGHTRLPILNLGRSPHMLASFPPGHD